MSGPHKESQSPHRCLVGAATDRYQGRWGWRCCQSSTWLQKRPHSKMFHQGVAQKLLQSFPNTTLTREVVTFDEEVEKNPRRWTQRR